MVQNPLDPGNTAGMFNVQWLMLNQCSIFNVQYSIRRGTGGWCDGCWITEVSLDWRGKTEGPCATFFRAREQDAVHQAVVSVSVRVPLLPQEQGAAEGLGGSKWAGVLNIEN